MLYVWFRVCSEEGTGARAEERDFVQRRARCVCQFSESPSVQAFVRAFH